jgi:hypothetical protein
MDIKLVKGRRYLFHNQKFQFRFRANFIDIITRGDGFRTLRVDKYIYESGEKIISELVAMPFSWIDKIETLVDIISSSNVDIINSSNVDITNSSNNILCNDILLEIDSFL